MQVVQFPSDDPEVPEQVATAGLRINLGCNQNPRKGYVNVDIEPFAGVDVVADLEKRWPWEDESAIEIVCADLPEHIRMWWEEPDPDLMDTAYRTNDVATLINAIRSPKRTYGIIHFMNEAYRVLKPGGRLDALIPSTDARGWAQDPTHVSYWNENSIQYFVDGSLRNLYPHLIKAKFKPLWVGTSVVNTMKISWVHAVLEK